MWSTCRNRAMRRTGYKCVLCGGHAEEVDHIVPVKLGGTSDASNLRPLCLPCHKGETARLAKEKTKYIAHHSVNSYRSSSSMVRASGS